MKKLIIIDTFITSKKVEETLNECIDNLKNKGYDLMVVSHKPIPKYIQDKLDYVIFDKDNTLLPYEITPITWVDTDNFRAELYDRGHSLTICKNMFTSINFSKILKYEFFYFLEFDNLFSELDIIKLDDMRLNMFNENKKMVLFKQINDDNEIYETLIFGGIPEYFLNAIQLPTTIDEYINLGFESTLEISFNKKLKKYEKDFYVIDKASDIFFDTSVINKFSQTSFKCEVIANNLDDRLLLWLSNDLLNKNNIDFILGLEKITLTPNSWHIRYLNLGDELTIKIIDEELIVTKNFKINKENKNTFLERGMIYFKNN